MKLRSLTLIVMLVLLAGLQSFAQTATGSIVGVVKDPSGNILPNAQITLTDVGTSETSHTTSNDSGYYSFTTLRPSFYQLSVEAAGFKHFIQQNVQLDVAATLTVNPIM